MGLPHEMKKIGAKQDQKQNQNNRPMFITISRQNL